MVRRTFQKKNTDNLEVGDGTGATRRVLLEGDPIQISYNDLTDKPALLQGEQGPAGLDSTVPGPAGKDGISPDASAFVSNPTYESNTLAILNYEVENLGDPEIGTA